MTTVTADAQQRPLPDLPEVPEGVTPTPAHPRWKPWTAFGALLAGFGGAIAAAILVGLVATIAGADLGDPPPSVNIIDTVVQDGCLIGSALLFARMAGRVAPRQFGLRPTRIGRALGWTALAYFVFICFSAAWISILGIHDKDELPKELGVDKSTVALLSVAVLVTVVAPIAEEFFFRGYFFGALRNWKGLWPAAILTGLVFGGIHAGSAPVGFLVPLAFFGFALCLLYARTRSLYPCIGLHCLNNSIAFGSSQHWDWQIGVLLAGSLIAIFGLLAFVQRAFGSQRALAPAA